MIMQEALNIQTLKKEDELELILKGRLDAFGSRTLENELQDQIKQGYYKLVLNFKETVFLSSAGIRILIKYYKDLTSIGGYLHFIELSDPINHVIELAGLKHLFLDEGTAIKAEAESEKEIDTTSGTFKLLQQQEKYFSLQTLGNPAVLTAGGYTAQNADVIGFPSGKYAIGLGAIGENFEDCKSRFGEYLAVGNTAFYMPTDGTKSADYMQRTDRLIPKVVSLYSVVFEGEFGTFLNFEVKKPASSIPLSEIVQTAFNLQKSQIVGMVILAETSGLCGCSLNISPVSENNRDSPFYYPEIKDRVNFTTEPDFEGSLTLTSGIVQKDCENLDDFTRPIGDQGLRGHFHSAVFSFRPMPKNDPDLTKAVNRLLDGSKLLSVLHLLDDNRLHNGIGESSFVRGTCWIGPVKEPEKSLP